MKSPSSLLDPLYDYDDWFCTGYSIDDLMYLKKIFVDSGASGSMPHQTIALDLIKKHNDTLLWWSRQTLGKSQTMAVDFIDTSHYNPGSTSIACALSLSQIKGSMIGKIDNFWNKDPHGAKLIRKVYNSDNGSGGVQFNNGSQLRAFGLPNMAAGNRVRGATVESGGKLYIDEFDFMLDDVISKILKAMTLVYRAKRVMACNPTTIVSRSAKLKERAKAGQPGTAVLHLPPYISPLYDAEELCLIADEEDEETLFQEYFGIPTESSKLVYKHYSDVENVKPFIAQHPKYSIEWINKLKHYSRGDKLVFGLDFNSGKGQRMCGSLWLDAGIDVYCVDEIVLPGGETHEMVQEAIKRYRDKGLNVVVAPDASSQFGGGANFRMVSDDFDVAVSAGNAQHKDSISLIRKLIKTTTGKRRLFVDPSCKEMRKTFINYAYQDGSATGNLDRKSGYDHMADGAEYALRVLRGNEKKELAGIEFSRNRR